VRISGTENPFYLHKLAAAYVETGDFSKAVVVADRALKLAAEQSNSGLAAELQRRYDPQSYKTGLILMKALC
jgi:hypothetical protein